MKRYVESYLTLLEKFYEHNRLKINCRKTKILMTKKTEKHNSNAQMKFRTSNGESIIESNSIKVLGITKNNRDS